MRFVLFHPGTQHSRQTARALATLDRLAFFATSLFPSEAVARRFPQLAAFTDSDLDRALVRQFGHEEWAERIAARLGMRSLAGWIDRLGNRRFGTRVAGAAARRQAGLWGFDGSSATAFADARFGERIKILDRTIGDWRTWNAIAPGLREEWGDWFTPADAPVSERRIANDRAEYTAATHILTPAPFVARTIARHEGADIADKCVDLPYAHDDRLFARLTEPEPVPASEPVRFLFVGHLSLRKGLPYLLAAFARLPVEARLTLVGELAVRPERLTPFADRVDYVGRVSRADMPALMRRHHALVLPSWFEGSAIALLEAQASGLAIVQTRMAGRGASEGSGFVIDRPDIDALEAAMTRLLDRDLLSAMRVEAWRSSRAHDHAAYTAAIGRFLTSLG